jgi:hypothetical protein
MFNSKRAAARGMFMRSTMMFSLANSTRRLQKCLVLITVLAAVTLEHSSPAAAIGKTEFKLQLPPWSYSRSVIRVAAKNTPLNDPQSTLEGPRYEIPMVIRAAYEAGFQTEEQLVTAVAIAISESGLYSKARNWHPEKGFRPSTDVITVKGPAEVWKNGGQMHSDRGIWQIASIWYPEYSDVVADDLRLSSIVAFNISNSGGDFRYWDSFANSNAQKLFDQAYDGWPPLRPIVKQFLAKQKQIGVSIIDEPVPRDIGH